MFSCSYLPTLSSTLCMNTQKLDIIPVQFPGNYRVHVSRAEYEMYLIRVRVGRSWAGLVVAFFVTTLARAQPPHKHWEIFSIHISHHTWYIDTATRSVHYTPYTAPCHRAGELATLNVLITEKSWLLPGERLSTRQYWPWPWSCST